MSKKKRISILLSDDAYKVLSDLLGVTLRINGHSYALDSKSKIIEVLLSEVRFDIQVR